MGGGVEASLASRRATGSKGAAKGLAAGTRDCSCILNGLKCTVVCKLQGCSNMVQDDAIVAQDANDSDGDSDD
ncbi:hypothetical protein GWK47_052614 [Chionoecetes opilio]|uniref:Uncharacterized protein n=1 Tax=Chionoecetes opilio TaxID=41210 RepID=A0A8J5CRN5_CHIOP|nr:hypothetical protein GWK47_052614 [Chionoecetes opilio]